MVKQKIEMIAKDVTTLYERVSAILAEKRSDEIEEDDDDDDIDSTTSEDELEENDTGKKPLSLIVCEHCEQTFSSDARMRRHATVAHNQPGQVMCTVSGCDAIFDTEAALGNHLIDCHSRQI